MKFRALLLFTVLAVGIVLIENWPATYAINGSIQRLCYTEDYEYIDGTGNHFISDVGEQYKFLVNAYNAAVNAIKSSNPTITLEDLNAHLAQGQGYQKMISLQNCFKANGLNPELIAQMNPNLSQVTAIPEFGSLANLAMFISVISVIIVSKKLRFLF